MGAAKTFVMGSNIIKVPCKKLGVVRVGVKGFQFGPKGEALI